MRRCAIGVILAGVVMLSAYAQTTVTVSPTAVSLHLGTFYQFSARVTGTTPTSVAWSIALPAGVSSSQRLVMVEMQAGYRVSQSHLKCLRGYK